MAKWVHVVLIPYKFFSYIRSLGFSSFCIKVENSEYYQALNIWFSWNIYSTLDYGPNESNNDPYLRMTHAFCFRICLSYFSDFLHIFSGLKGNGYLSLCKSLVDLKSGQLRQHWGKKLLLIYFSESFHYAYLIFFHEDRELWIVATSNWTNYL